MLIIIMMIMMIILVLRMASWNGGLVGRSARMSAGWPFDWLHKGQRD